MELSDSVLIRHTRMRNRLCIAPMVCFGWGNDEGLVSDQHVAHYRALAEGGAGLVIVEATCVTREGRLAASQLGIWDDAHVPGLARIAEAIHAAGASVLLQIHHAGVTGIAEHPLCPDAYAFQKNGVTRQGVKMTPADIAQIQAAFVDAGRRAEAAGFDGVELHGCHRYLLCQFFNARVNRRTDAYGADSTRMTAEIADALRQSVRDDFIIGIRLGAFEPILDDGIRHALALRDKLDFFDISYGFSGEDQPSAPDSFPYKDVIYAAGQFKAALGDHPIFAVNGIRTPQDARGILALTHVDMLNIGRSALVDPNWPRKTLSGQAPAHCLGCSPCQAFASVEACQGRKIAHKK